MSYGNQPGGYGPPPGGGYGPPKGPGDYGPGGGYDPYGYGPQPPRGNNGMAIASLIMGIVGLFTCGLASVVGIVLGHISLSQIKRTGEEGRGAGVAGLILSYFGIFGWLLLLGFAVMLGWWGLEVAANSGVAF
ncbi:DUF4190 domain-containing protein [Planomonospora sp. ID67723]|uniref:DUF4190 domain-containing protein n=1 Tax=Planomonospora sp. ID67723 TaxID=2738134 RepID=UPI0018C3BB0F|nr:DUF4190 domain-containing protein [Planomonospora sp. ID67723]MBG0829576.1 DUF4190 domain-containing protein [Planomonospora sp. ID67723]